MGGHLNAYTSREQTVYVAKVLKKDVPRAVDILADIVQNSTYPQDRVEAERSTILREMEEVRNAFDAEARNTDCGLFLLVRLSATMRRPFSTDFMNLLIKEPPWVAPSWALRRTSTPSLASALDLYLLSRAVSCHCCRDLVDFVKTHYTGNRIVVAGAGAVSQQQLADLTGKAFKDLPAKPSVPVEKKPCKYTGSGMHCVLLSVYMPFFSLLMNTQLT